MTRRRGRGIRARGGLKAALIEAANELGPGVITGAADDDPSGIATYSQAGAQFGYALLWTQVLTYPLMCAVQLVSAHIGRVTGGGLAKNLAASFPKWIVHGLVGVLVLANSMNIGADLTAMAAGADLLVGGHTHLFVLGFALASVLLQLFVPYHQYARVLKWLTLSLFAYIGVLLTVQTDWWAAVRGMVWPSSLGRDAVITIVALFGTTISPYLFFWQSSQEAEEIADEPRQKPLKDDPKRARRQFRRMRLDTFVGMAFSNLVALAIIMAAAATLHPQGVSQIGTAAEAAQALRPIAGQFAFLFFALGIIGTGLLAVPVLAGSAAFAVSEVQGWRGGLEYQPRQAVRFYAIIVAATAAGLVLDWTNVNPIRALFWSAVLNGIAAAPIMAAMMILASRRSVMGKFVASRPLAIFGWTATAVMAAATLLLFASLL
jgi:NRAMP (natural resistance-associated macrophage protein)-like metal ion transporter